MARPISLIPALVGVVALVFAQDVMTNDTVVKMVKAGLSEGVIVESINQRLGGYALSPDDLISLKTANVSDAVISAMQAKMKPQEPSPLLQAPQPSQLAPATAGGNPAPTPARRTSTDEISFHKTKLADVKGDQANAILTFSGPRESVIVNAAGHTIATIPYASIDKISYEYSKHHRIKQGAIVMVASLGAGAVVMLTKSKTHWLTFEYREENAAKTLVLRMDKGEYRNILKVASAQTDKQVAVQNY